MRRKAKKSKLFLILILVLGISVGYAALSKTLRINGTSSIKKSSWIIYFDNIRNESGVTAATQTTISNDKTEVNFKISIDKPGDFYEFDVDTVNDGSIDAMIDSVELTGIKAENENSFSLTTTYEDGTELKKCDILQAGTRKKVKVRFYYNTDIEANELLEEEEKMNLQFKINYVQNTVCENNITLNIDPNGGKYQNLDKVTKVSVAKNTTYSTLGTPTRRGYIFQYWETEDGTRLEKNNETNNYIVNIRTSNLTVRAVWEQDLRDYVARINDDYYETIQDAIDEAGTDDVIYLLKSTTESPTNNKKVTLELEGFTVTGTLTNTTDGDITLKNGKIKSDTIALVNNGTLTLGVNDGDYQIDDIIIEGETKGLEQNNNFYFYDGYLQALQGIEGGCNGKEDGYYIYVDSVKINNVDYQKVYLVDHPLGNFMTINGQEFYFKSLQYAVASTDNEHPTVYVIAAEAESSAAITVAEGQILTLDMNGKKLTYGAPITNNGTFTVTDSQTTKGSFEIALPIVNNSTLNVNNAVINQTTTNGSIIDNNKDINITKSTLTAKSGNVIYNLTSGTTSLDSDTTLTSSGYAFNNNAEGQSYLTGGNISSINEQKGTLTVSNVTLNSTRTEVINITAGTLNIKSGAYSTTGKILINKTGGDLVIDGGTFTVNYTATSYSYVGELKNGNTTINGGTFRNNGTYVNNYVFDTYYDTVVINNGTFESERGMGIYSNSGTLTIKNGNFNMKSSCVNNYFVTNIEGGTFYCETGEALRIGDGSTISGGNITSVNSYALNISTGKVTITGGTLISENSIAIYSNSSRNNLIVKGGTIKGKTYGIQTVNNASLTVGANGETLNVNSPIIEGELYGVYLGGSMSFYDGTLKGKTAGYQGTINTIRTKHLVINTTETRENGDVYNITYLAPQPNFLRTNDGEDFNNLQDAVNHIANTATSGTITVTENATYTDTTTIPSGKEITLDLAGKTLNLTKNITIYGNLTAKDSVGTGTLASTAKEMFYVYNRNAALTINNGNFTGNDIVCSNGTVHVIDGTFTGKTVFDIGGGTVTIDDADVTASVGGIYNSGGTITINNVTINYNGGSGGRGGINNSNGTVTIENAEITSTYVAITNLGTMTINNGTYTSNDYRTIYNDKTLIINGGEITSTNNYALYNLEKCTITSGTLKSESTYGIYNYRNYSNDSPDLTITGGTVIGKTDGIYNNYIVTIGTKDSTINNSTPIIQGEDYGLNIVSGTANFYDGTLKGKTRGYNGLFYDLPTNSIISESTEVISGETYNTAFIGVQAYFVETDDGERFQSLQDAIGHLGTTGTMKLVATVSASDEATVPTGANITLDLNGLQYNTSKTITNNGTFTITDNSVGATQDSVGGINNTKSNIINNTGNLTIKKGLFESQQYGIYQTLGNTTIDGGSFKNTTSSLMAIYKDGGDITINDGTFTSTSSNSVNSSRTTVYLKDGISTINGGTFIGANFSPLTTNNDTITINGGTFTHSIQSPYSAVTIGRDSTCYIYDINILGNDKTEALLNQGTTTIYGGTFESNSSNKGAIYNYYGNITINGGTFTGNKYGVQNENGTATINGGQITSKSYGVYLNKGTVNLGKDDGNINATVPAILGDLYGVYVNSGTFNFYDGILKGKTASYNNVVNSLATDAQVKTESEVIDDETYTTSYLIKQTYVIQNENTHEQYKDINEALGLATTNDRLTLIDNASTYDVITIPDKNLTIDLNNFTITANKQIINEGKTSIIDDSDDKNSSIVTSGNFILLTNNNELTISDTNISNNTNNEVYLISNSNNKTLTISNTPMSGAQIIKNVGLGTVTVNDSNITATYYGIYNPASGTINTNNTNVTTELLPIYNYDGVLNIDGGTIKSISSASGSVYSMKSSSSTIGKSTIKNATIAHNNSSTTAFNNQSSEFDITNVIFQGKIYNTMTTNITGGSSTGKIKNQNGTMTIDGFTANAGIVNNGSMTVTNSTVNLTYGTNNWNIYDYYGIENTSNISLSDVNINTTSENSRYNFYGIYNTGTLSYNGGTMNILKGTTNYGIYNNGGTMTMLTGTINVNQCTTAYGVYQTSGEMIFGHLEGTGQSANPSTTSPLVKAVGSTTGIGVRKADGYFRYFDGKFIGSTGAKPEAPTQIEEPDYEVTYGTDSDGYNYCILTYLEQH